MGHVLTWALALVAASFVVNSITASTFSCPLDTAGGYSWSATTANTVVKGHCNYADAHFVKNIASELSRTCDSKGVWSAVDFTGCTVMPGTGPILLIWHLLRTGSIYTVDQRTALLEAAETQLLSGISVPFVSVTRAFSHTVNGNVSITFQVMLNKTELDQAGSAARLDRTLTALNVTTLYHYTVLPTGGGHQIIIPSDSCQCRPSVNSSIVQVCTDSYIPPCSCTSTGCKCKNNYIGDGIKCTPDTDGDGYPNVPLDSCSNSSNITYCIKDVCPQTYNPAQNPLDCTVLPDYIGCHYGKDPIWPIYWANTPYNTTNIQKCPSGPDFSSRLCSSTGWEQAKISHCKSHAFKYVEDHAAASLFSTGNTSITTSLQQALDITSSLLILSSIPTDPNASSLLPQDLNLTSYVIKKSVDVLHLAQNSSHNLTTQLDLIDLFNNILHGSNINGWLSLQELGSGSQLLLDSAERYALHLLSSNQSQVHQRSDIVFGVKSVNCSGNNDYTFPTFIDDIQNYTNHECIPAQITIGQEHFAGNNTPVVTSILFNNMESILPVNSSNTSIASKVISSQVSRTSSNLATSPAKLQFTFNYTNYNSSINVARYQCVYWQSDTKNFSNGYWSTEGLVTTNVTTLEDGTIIVDCKSSHLTSFAVLVDVSGVFSSEESPSHSPSPTHSMDVFIPGDNVSNSSSECSEFNETTTPNRTRISLLELQAMNIVSYIGCAISIVSLVIAVIFFLSLKKTLLTSVSNFIHLNLSISLLVAYLLFSVGVQTATSSVGGCIFVATLLHYFLLASFSWMLCEGIMLFLMLVVVFSTMAKKWWGFFILGWGLPLPVVIVSVAARHSQYGIRDSSGNLNACWLPSKLGIIWAFVGPMLLAIAANIVFIALALFVIARAKYRTQKRSQKHSQKLFWTLMSATISLLPLLGLTWVFGLLVVNQNTTVFAWLFTIFNSLQGLFILIFHVLRNDKFKKTWLYKTIAQKSGLKRTTTATSNSGSTIRSRVSRTSQASVSSEISKTTQLSRLSIASMSSLPTTALVFRNPISEVSGDILNHQLNCGHLKSIKETMESGDDDFNIAEKFMSQDK